MIYTKLITDVSRFSSKFIMALSYKIAGYIASRVTGGDPFKLKEAADRSYFQILKEAQAIALNEQRIDVLPESEFITARD